MKLNCILIFLLLLSFSNLAYSDDTDFASFAFSVDTAYLIEGLMKGGYGSGNLFEIVLVHNFSLTLNAGYTEYKTTENNTTNRISYTSIYSTVRYYFDGKLYGLYIGGGIGSTYNTYNDLKATGYLIPLEGGIRVTFFGKRGIFCEPNIRLYIKYVNSGFLFDTGYGINIGFSF
jgi:hypothetical protein